MSQKGSFALEPRGPKRLSWSCGLDYENFTVELDGAPVLVIATRVGLEEGRQIQTDAGLLLARLTGNGLLGPFNIFGPKLLLSIDGRPIPGSDGDPATRVREAAIACYIVGGLVLLSFVAGLVNPSGGWGGWLNVPLGVAFIVAGLGVQKLHSMIALLVALCLLLTESVFTAMRVLPAMGGGGAATTFGPVIQILWRVAFLVPLFKGIGALDDIAKMSARKKPREDTPPIQQPASPTPPTAESIGGQVSKAPDERRERECPFCAERILVKATRCRFCGQTVEPIL